MVEQISPGRYNIARAFRLKGALNQKALCDALDTLISRHEVLRTRFEMREGMLEQRVAPHQPLPTPTLDLRSSCEDSAAILHGFLSGIARATFDLARDPMLRVGLARMADDEFVLAMTLHHIAADGWSLGVFDRELALLYAAFDQQHPIELPPLPIQYSDFAMWQREQLSGALLEEHMAYWRKALAGVAPIELIGDRPRSMQLTDSGATEPFTLPPRLVAQLKALARKNNVTLFMILLTAFQVLLMRYTGDENVAVASPVAGRGQPELEALVGLFVNTVVMRGDLAGNPSFSDALVRIRKSTVETYAHQDAPFEKLVEELSPDRDPTRTPLFQVTFALQIARASPFGLPGLQVERVPLDCGSAKFDLSFFLKESNGSLEGAVEYAADLFDRETIVRLARHYQTLLSSVAEDSSTTVWQIPLLDAAERHQLVVDWNATRVSYPGENSLGQIFEHQVACTPENVAAASAADVLTYRELNQQANRLAHYLGSIGVARGSTVGVCTERSPAMLVAMLAIVKAGAAYLPLDPDDPPERLLYVLKDAQVDLVLSGSAIKNKLRIESVAILCLDTEFKAWEHCANDNLPSLASAGDPVYVMYTSGSTGAPKGVVVAHRGVARLVCNADYVHLDSTDCMAQVANPAFDAATFEIWGALCNGARLAIMPREVTLDPARLTDALRSFGVSTLFLTTALFNEVVRIRPGAFAELKQVLFGGETADGKSVTACLAAGPPDRLLHMYGPTETTTFATWHRVTNVASAGAIPIGRPIANTTVYVLDGHHQPVPVGVPGELYIGGDGVARGYLNRPELTAERFLPDPFSSDPGARLYRTGDRVRFTADGNLEFLGRFDSQIKLRGFRIELGEIEAVLLQQPQVRQAVVLLREDRPGDPRLVAYVVMDSPPASAGDLRSALKRKLPDYMIPAAFVPLPALPLTANGKLDRKALPAPANELAEAARPGPQPIDNIERHLVRIWEVLLKREPVAVDQNFFDLGGHSLLAVQLIDQIEKTFSRRLPLDCLWFGAGTIEELAALIREEYRSAPNPEVIAIKGGSRRPLFVVHTMGGNLFHYYDLSRHLHADQSVYGLQARGVFGTGRPDRTVQAIAAHCITAMRGTQPRGPYLITGFSSGGIVAYEMAQQLISAGEPVALLALIDTYTPRAIANKRWLTLVRKLMNNKATLREVQEVAYFTILHGMKLDRYRNLRSIGEAHRWAHWSYMPKQYPRAIEFFVAEQSAARWARDRMGWAPYFTGAARIHQLPGRHGDLVKPPAVAELASELQSCIDAVSAEGT